MNMRWTRIFIAALAAEVLCVLGLMVTVALLGPDERGAAEAYAHHLGVWFSPVCGGVLCLLGGYWAAKGSGDYAVPNGFLVGALAAALNLVLLFSAGAPVRSLLGLANIARVAGGAMGGWFGGRS